MEQRSISNYTPIKFAFATFFAHITLYLQLFVFVAAVVFVSTLVKNYLITTEFIPAGHLNQVSYLIFEYFFKFWFWGACVVIAHKIVHTARATVMDFVASLRYVPQFIILQLVFCAPYMVGWYLVVGKDFEYPIREFIAIGWLVFMIVGFVWSCYGQLAIPIFVAEKQDIVKTIMASVRGFIQERWYVLELLFVYGLIGFGLFVFFSLLMYIFGLENYTPLLSMLGYPISFMLYALMALSYVYVYDYSRRNRQPLL